MVEGDKMEGGHKDANERERKKNDRKKTGKYNQCHGSVGCGGHVKQHTAITGIKQ